MNRRLPYLALFLSICASSLFAQQLKVPQASPHAVVEETLGVTSISVDYHRPSVNNRKIFGGLVPYDVLWRAGANQPTHITFSTPVKVEGQDVPAGTYSLFFIPGQQQWTLVLSTFTGGWGTYSYDPSEDLVRVKVTPQPADMTERMAFTFDDAKDNSSVNLAMRWEKLRVPVKIEADTKKLVAEGIKRDLRSELYWNAPVWTQAASYMLSNGNDDLALQYVNHAIDMQPSAQNLRLKARIIEKKGDAEGAKTLRAQADKLMTPEIATVSNAYRLISQKKYDEAIAAIGDNKSWRALNAIGDAWAAKGDKAKAMEWYDKAMSAASNQTERVEVQDSINALGADTKS
jgi:Uncharacterized protein conserved in bacteria